MRRVIENTELLETIRALRTCAKQNKSPIWTTTADQLSRPRKDRAEINLRHITRSTEKNTVVLVPGKVLGAGLINHAVIVGALEFSRGAQRKIERAGGKCVTIREFIKQYPDGSNVQLMR